MAKLVTTFLVLFSVSVQGSKYTVKMTSPNQGVHVGANVSLDCTINPQPSEPYQYKWSASQGDAGWTTTDAANGSTLVAAVGINSTRHVRYFCSVYSRNVLLASGSLAVEIKGWAKDARISLSQSTGALQLEVVPTAVSARLSWYHNYGPVDPTYDARLQLSNTTASLVIKNPSPADTGTYTARVSSLELTRGGPSTACGRNMANLLQGFAVVAPTEFTVFKNPQEMPSNQSELSSQVPLQQQMYVAHQHAHIKVTMGLANIGATDATTALVEEALKMSWYHEGRIVSDGDSRYGRSVDILPDGTVSATLVISNAAKEDAGVYAVEAFIATADVDVLRLGIGEDCRDYVVNLTSAMGAERIILGTGEVNLVLYELPRVVLSANETILSKDEVSTLTCSLEGGAGDKVTSEGGAGDKGTTTIRWLKGGSVLSESRGTVSQLLTSQIKASLPIVGKYSCLVVGDYYAEEKSLVLLEEASIGMKLTFVNETSCIDWKESYLQETERAFVEVVVAILSNISQTAISSDAIRSPSMVCQRGGAALLFRGDLVYANLKGDVTASSLLLQTKGIINGTVMLGALLYQVSTVDDVQDLSGDASELPSTMRSNDGPWIGPLVTICVCGVLLGTFIIIVITRRYMHRSRKINQDWLLMDSVENQ